MTDSIRAAILCALLLGGVTGGWFARSWYDGSMEADRLKAEQATRDKMVELSSQIAASTEAAISKIRIQNRNIYHETEREIRSNPVYSECILPDGGRMRVNQARGGPAASQPGSAVRPDAAP